MKQKQNGIFKKWKSKYIMFKKATYFEKMIES